VNALLFLGIALGLSLLGCGLLWIRSRQPGSMEAHIRDFERELDALAPGSPPDRRGRPSPRDERRPGGDNAPDPRGGPGPG
jgi:hypothetical protein